jgi:Fuc2NAc and GlcNAc transferase
MNRVAAELLTISAGVLAVSMFTTGAVRRLALLHGVVDVPNERSSHSRVTPRGGGIAIVAATSIAVIVLRFLGVLSNDLSLALLGGGTLVAITGLLDDRKSIHAGVRLTMHFAAAVWALICLGGLSAVQLGKHAIELGWMGNVLAVLAIVWTLNFFNFMDGIDGIAATEAVFVAGCGAWLSRVGSGLMGVCAVGTVLAAASAGFLVWNWAPAAIFMGDVGSGYLGYVIGVLAVAATRDNPVAPWTWLLLGGAFFVDATVTLIRRALRHEHLHEAHRSHAYQWLARRWGSHRRVTLAVLAVNIAWLLPCTLLALRHPSWSMWLAFGGLAPLVLAAFLVGSGRREQRGAIADSTP